NPCVTASCKLEMIGVAVPEALPGHLVCMANTDSPSPENLAALIKQGAPEAAAAGELIVSRLSGPLRKIVMGMSVSEDVGEVILQETWKRFFRSAVHRFRGDSLLSFLTGVARNVFLAWLRWKRTRRVFSFADFSAEEAAEFELRASGAIELEQFGDELDRT